MKPTEISSQDKEFAMLSYFWIFSLFVYYSPEGKNDFVRHHAKQGVFLFFLSLLFFFFPFQKFFHIVLVCISVLGVFEASQGKKYSLPFLSFFIENKFSPERYKDFCVFWFQKFLSFFQKRKEKKNEEESRLDILKGSSRSLWNDEVKNAEKFFFSVLEKHNIKGYADEFGIKVFVKKDIKVYFGKVTETSFSVLYRFSDIPISQKEKILEFERKEFLFSSSFSEEFRDFIELVLYP
jgi:uncharacterized membrane protein